MSRRLENLLSEEGKKELLNRLEKLAKNSLEEANTMFDGSVTTDFIKKVTNITGIEEVIDKNEQLTQHFKGFLDMYGFDNMYDMYMYAISCDQLQEQIKKSKDYSRLVPVKRKIVRNGKEVEVTIWQKPDEVDQEETEYTRENQTQPKPRKIRHAREANSRVLETNAELNPKELANIKSQASDMPNGDKPFSDDSQYYLAIEGEDGEIIGVVGYSEEGNYLTMDFYRTNGKVSGVASRGFFELMKIAYDKNKGVKMEDIEPARPIFIQSGLEQKSNGYWVIDKNKLKEVLSFGD